MIDIEKCLEIRKEIIEKTKAEMLGPGSEDVGPDIEREVISDSPIERYSLGVLFPQNNIHKIDDEEKPKKAEDSTEEIIEENIEENNYVDDKNVFEKENSNIKSYDNDDGESQEQISMANQLLPSAMGLTFFAQGYINELNVKVNCAKYKISKFRDCAVRLKDSFEFDKSILSEYVYAEDNLVKLKQNISKKIVFELISGKDIEKDRPDVINVLYKLADQCTDEQARHNGYVRIPFLVDEIVTVPLNNEFNKMFIDEDGNVNPDQGILKVTVLRKKYSGNVWSYTIMLVNEQIGEKSYKNSIFQPKLIIDTELNKNIKFIEHTNITNRNAGFVEEEEQVLNMLYRNKKSYSVGHGVATGQSIDSVNQKEAIFTNFFPSYEVPQLDFNIKEIENISGDLLSMFKLSDISDVSKEEKLSVLKKFSKAYENWIIDLESYSKSIDVKYQEVAKKQIKSCRYTLDRINAGIDILSTNENVYTSFSLMNRAMLMQRAHSNVKERFPFDEEVLYPEFEYKSIDVKKASWRPFQLAFILMNIESISDPNCKERDIVELIWVPTGGGKTEAYLGITAFSIFLRRLNDPVNGGGTTIIMRYTLRLLAAQQFIRAAILICACEKIRRETKNNILGKEEISIGLWVGGTPTPNTNDEAKTEFKKLTKAVNSEYELSATKIKHNKFQVLKCPWCGTKLEVEYVDGKKKGLWGYDYDKKKIIFCPEFQCDFNKRLPIQVVDEELYKNPPTLLFGTVDKFATLPWKGEVSNLFALNQGNNNKQPELIIQDELHLISGPLGTMVGLYETAIDAMCSHKGIKPKIIASTATIRRASEQCKMLFNRNVVQFPPSGLDIEDSFFTREISIEKKFGRLYVGLMPSGKTATTAQVRLYTALLQGVKLIDAPEDVLDKYWTLVGYFNSIRELGKSSTLVKDDIASNNMRYMKRLIRRNDLRYATVPRELTSRLEATEIIKTLKDLDNEYSKSDNKAINVLLATNMISVGVDVSRLDLMAVAGQPKQTAEYIQATSRVGRTYPGLVFTMYNGSKTRDRSHYELFYPYHQTFYKYVEPTSVTPFSEKARERALHAVFISMVRHTLGLNNDEDASNFNENIENLDKVKQFILDRAQALDNSQLRDITIETEKELKEIIRRWTEKVNTASIDEHVHYFNNKADKNLLLPFLEEDERNAFPTMQSMRNVDGEAGIEIIEFGGEIDEED
jgi:hypothetical protein